MGYATPAAEGQRVLLAVHGVVGVHAHEAALVKAGGLDVAVQGLLIARGLPVQQVGDLLDHEHVAGIAAGEHRGGLHGVVLGGDVDVLDGDAGMGGLKGFLLGGQIGGGGGVPGDDGQRLGVLGHGEAARGQQHQDCQDQSKGFLHEWFLLLIVRDAPAGFVFPKPENNFQPSGIIIATKRQIVNSFR